MWLQGDLLRCHKLENGNRQSIPVHKTGVYSFAVTKVWRTGVINGSEKRPDNVARIVHKVRRRVRVCFLFHFPHACKNTIHFFFFFYLNQKKYPHVYLF